MNSYKIKLSIIYGLLAFGGIWNYFGIFQSVMQSTAGLMIILITFYLFYEIQNKKISEHDSAGNPLIQDYKVRMLLYFIFVIAAGWLIEFIGVSTGYIFGNYKYSKLLLPQILDVPIAIGFAWFSTLIVSVAIIQTYTKINIKLIKTYKKALLTGFLMTVFDYFLEFAAIKLGYWSWQIGIPPFTNYLAWFVFGSLFAYIGFKINLLDLRLPKIASHLYFAQLIYFGLSAI